MAISPIRAKRVAKGDPMQIVHNRLDEHAEMLADHEKRLVSVESMAQDVRDVANTVNSIMRYLKVATPSIISAAVAAGIVNGKLAEFLKALLGG